jgi:tetratricopeptide (TPR) repeat protein
MKMKTVILFIIAVFAITYIALSLKSDNAFVEFNKGKDLFENLKFNSAIIPLSNSIKIDSSYAEAYNLRGVCYLNLKQYSEALEDFNKALEIYLNKYKLLKLSSKGNSEEVQLNQSISNSYFNRALVYQEIEEMQKALNDYNFVIDNDKCNKIANLNRGYIYNELGKTDSAIKCFKSVISIDSTNKDANYNLARIYYSNKNFQKAKPLYEKLLELGLSSEEILVNLANCYFNEKEYQIAIDYYNLAIKTNKSNALTYCNRGKAYHEMGNDKLAVKDYNYFIKIASNDPKYKSYIPSIQQEVDFILYKSRHK